MTNHGEGAIAAVCLGAQAALQASVGIAQKILGSWTTRAQTRQMLIVAITCMGQGGKDPSVKGRAGRV